MPIERPIDNNDGTVTYKGVRYFKDYFKEYRPDLQDNKPVAVDRTGTREQPYQLPELVVSAPAKDIRFFNDDGSITYLTKPEADNLGYQVYKAQDGNYTAVVPVPVAQPNHYIPEATIGPAPDRRSMWAKILDNYDLYDRAGDGSLMGNLASNLVELDQGRNIANGLWNTFGEAATWALGEGLVAKILPKLPKTVHLLGLGSTALGYGLPMILGLTSASTPHYATDDIDNDSLYKYFPELKNLKSAEQNDILLNYSDMLNDSTLTDQQVKTLGTGSNNYFYNKATGKFEKKDTGWNWWDYTWRIGANLATVASDIYLGYMLAGKKLNFDGFKKVLKGVTAGIVGIAGNAAGIALPWMVGGENTDEQEKQLKDLYDQAVQEYNKRVSIQRSEKARQIVEKQKEAAAQEKIDSQPITVTKSNDSILDTPDSTSGKPATPGRFTQQVDSVN